LISIEPLILTNITFSLVDTPRTVKEKKENDVKYVR
jgi:hypothetical protein